MSESHAPIPGPTPFDEAAGQRELPEELKPAEPAPYHVTQLSREGRDELGIVFKRTYGFQDGHVPWPDEEQPPLDPEGTPHDPLDPGGPPSYRSLPEVVAFKTGTDLVVQGCARPPRPTTRMQVGVRIGNVEHRADVLGPRRAEYVNGSLAFTPPEEFEAMPLRYENAYGGRDEPFEERLASEVEETTPAEDLRRARPSFEATFAEGHPLAYPRNRFGKGYVIEDRRELIEGRELPNLERPDDRLTPERLVVGHPMDWGKQPIPVGFDYLEPSAFPRTALLGIPQASRIPLGEMPEVRRGLVPPDYSLGTIFDREPSEFPRVIHSHGSRCASLGLWLPWLVGDEVLALGGMDPDRPVLRVQLPAERPAFGGRWPGSSGQELVGALLLVAVDVDARRLHLIWAARAPLARPLRPGEPKSIREELHIRMVEV